MQIESKNGYGLRISLFFGGYFLPFGIYIPFFAVWLKHLGLSPQDISLVLTIPLITRVAITPFMAGLADKLGDRRLTLRIYTSLYALLFALILLDNSFLWIVAIMILSNLFMCAILPVSDSLAMAGVRRFDLDYGRMRLWGSAAFILANLAGGLAISTWGDDKIIWMLVLGNLLQLIFSFALPQDPRLQDGKTLTKGTNLNWTQFKQFAQWGFWVVILGASLLQASHALLYGFATIFWQDRGISTNVIGFLWGFSVLAEILFFTYSRPLTKFLSWRTLFIIAAIGGTLRWSLFPLELSEEGYFLLQVLHALSFASAHLATMFFLAEKVDDHLSGTAQGLYTMLSGLFMAIGTMISGPAYGQWGAPAFYIMSALSLMSLLMFTLSKLMPIRKITPHETS